MGSLEERSSSADSTYSAGHAAGFAQAWAYLSSFLPTDAQLPHRRDLATCRSGVQVPSNYYDDQAVEHADTTEQEQHSYQGPTHSGDFNLHNDTGSGFDSRSAYIDDAVHPRIEHTALVRHSLDRQARDHTAPASWTWHADELDLLPANLLQYGTQIGLESFDGRYHASSEGWNSSGDDHQEALHCQMDGITEKNREADPEEKMLVAKQTTSSLSKQTANPGAQLFKSIRRRQLKGGAELVFRLPGRPRRAKFDETSRKATRDSRALGACPACKKKKVRCNQQLQERFVPCDRCARLGYELLKEPCCRIDILDIKLFRLGTTVDPTLLRTWMASKESTKGLIDLPDGTVRSEGPRKVQLTQDLNFSNFVVTVSRFRPDETDVTGFPYTDPMTGAETTYELPPYYIEDLEEATRGMRDYVRRARQEYNQLLFTSNPIVRATFAEAERYYTSSKSELIAAALLLWSTSRMIERTWLICGDDLLDMSPMQHSIGPCRINPRLRVIPATPWMDNQLDELAIETVLIPLSKQLLRLLKRKVLEKKRENWYELYLAAFIILHNGEQVVDDIVRFTQVTGMIDVPNSNSEGSLSYAYYLACKTLLSYFHFACDGAIPFSSHWSPGLHGADAHQIAYLQNLKTELDRQNSEIAGLKNMPMYQTELYWCHQLMFTDWRAEMPHQGEFLGFTEKDLLCA